MTYKKDSYEYRVLRLALSVLSDVSTFSHKVYLDNVCIKEFSVKDDVVCEYTQGGEKKKVVMSLAKLLPQYKNVSDTINKFTGLFEVKKDLDKFFDAKSLPLCRIADALKENLGLTPGEWVYNKNGNAYQYLFYVYYYKEKKGYKSSHVISIKLENETCSFVNELLDFLYDNNISIKESPFTYRLRHYFEGKNISEDCLLEEEKLLHNIKEWTDNDSKKRYLLDNEVLDGKCNSIMFRRLFLEDKPVDCFDKLSDQEKSNGIKFFATTDRVERPFKGKNQKDILLKSFYEKSRNLTSICDFDALSSNSKEWDNTEYKGWIQDYYPQIFLFDGELPMELLYENIVLLQFSEGHYIYNSSNRKLYVSRDEDLDQVLFQLAREGKSDLNLDDYKILCMNGKISVSRETIETKDKQICSLKKENQKKDKLLKRYRERYGDIENTIKSTTFEQNQIDIQENYVLQKQDESKGLDGIEIGNDYRTATDRDSIDKESRIELNREARNAAKDYLDSLEDFDCSDWNPNEGSGLVKNLIKYKGKTITVVVTSSIDRKLYLHPRLFAELMIDSNNLLLNYGYDRKIHRIIFDEAFEDNPNVNLIFDTDKITHEEFAFLANRYKYSKRTCFVIENISYSISEQIAGFGLNEKMSDTEVYTSISKDELFDF